MSKVMHVEEVEYETGPGENIIGFNLHYDDGVVYPIGPILIRAELEAIRADAYERGYREGAEQIRQDQELIDKHGIATTDAYDRGYEAGYSQGTEHTQYDAVQADNLTAEVTE